MKKANVRFYIVGFLAVIALLILCYLIFGVIFSDYSVRLVEELAQAKEAAQAELTGGEAFNAAEDAVLVDGVRALSVSDGGKLLMETEAQGLESKIVLSIVLDENGNVNKIMKLESGESPEYGELALEEAYLSSYYGKNSAEEVDGYTGATYTSDAIKSCVNAAFAQYGVYNGGSAEGLLALSPEEKIANAVEEVFGGSYTEIETKLKKTVTKVYQCEGGYAVELETLGYDQNPDTPIRLLVCLNEGGVIQKVFVIDHAESPAYGEKCLNENYLYQFEGETNVSPFDIGDGSFVVDAYSTATYTSNAVTMAVRTACAQVAELLG